MTSIFSKKNNFSQNKVSLTIEWGCTLKIQIHNYFVRRCIKKVIPIPLNFYLFKQPLG